MKTIRQYFGFLIAGILLFILIKIFIQTHKQLEDIILQIQWSWLVTSFVFILVYRSFYVFPFTLLLRGFSQGGEISFRNVFMLFHLANILRNLPGRVWGIVRLLSLSHRIGLGKIATGSCLTIHVFIETAFGGLIAIYLLFSKQMQAAALGVMEKFTGNKLVFTLIIIVTIVTGIVVCLLILKSKVSIHLRHFLNNLQLKGTPLFQKSYVMQWIYVLACHILLWICQGFAFYLFVRSFTDVPWTNATTLTACYAFAWICGFLSFLTPSGLGVREGLLSLLLACLMPTPHATFVALLCRIWMLLGELVLAGVAYFLKLYQENSVVDFPSTQPNINIQ